MKRVLKPEIKLGGERKKVYALIGLLVVAVAVYFYNSSGTPTNSPSSTAAVPALRPMPGVAQRITPRSDTRVASRLALARNSGRGSSLQEFKPTLKPKDPIDPSRVDPTLRLKLLAKLRDVNVSGGGRSLFDFSTAAAPKVEIATVKPIIPGGERKTAFIGPVKPEPPKPKVEPPPPPIPLKFYGFTKVVHEGQKQAFFLEGEDIFVAAEGDVIKNRYKVVQIGINSALVEDTSNKHQQRLPLETEAVSS